MISRSVLAACSLAAWLCLSAVAQSTGTAATPYPSQQTVPSQSQSGAKAPAGGLEPGAPPLQLQSLPPEPHTLTPQEKAKQQQERAYQSAIRLATLQARWGTAMSTPGVSMSLVETGRSKNASGQTQITYQIAASGFRAGERLNLIRWPLGQSMQTVMGGLVLNSQGRAVCSGAAPAAAPAAPAPSSNTATPPPARPAPPSCTKTMQPNQPIEIQTTAAPGEAIRAALVGEDHSNGAAAQAVPFPIENADAGCKLQVLLGVKDADLVVIEGDGFPPSSTISIDTVTGMHDQKLDSRSNAAGKVAFAVMPAQPGMTSGTTTVRFAGIVHPPTLKDTPAPAPDPSCAPSVSFHWGQGSYQPQ